MRWLSPFLVLIFAFQAPPELQDIFSAEGPIRMTIYTDLIGLQRDRQFEDSDYRPAKLCLPGEETISDTLFAKVRVRGNFRRQPDVCEWPPLKVKLDRGDAFRSPFGTHRKFKLVTNCQGEDYLFREYLVYKLYNEVTGYSFRVRLVDLILRDESGQAPDMHRWAFMIEDDEQLAARLGLTPTEGDSIQTDQLTVHNQAHLSLFQYVVGNMDWDVYWEKNVQLFYGQDGTPVAVPFDFDFSGCVNAPYSQLGDFELRNFRPICWDTAERLAILQHFQQLVPVWQRCIEDCEHLPADQKQEMLRYLSRGFKELEKDRRWDRNFPLDCDG